MRWSRRILTIPAAYLVTGLVLTSLPIGIWFTLLIDLGRRRRFAVTRTYLLTAGRLWFVSVCLFVMALQWMASLLPWNGHQRLETWTHQLATFWGHVNYRLLELIFGVRTIIQSSELPTADRPLIVFVRHVSQADALLPLELLGWRHGRRLRYVLKHALLMDPCIDVALQRVRSCFVQRGTSDGDREVRRVTGLLTSLGPRDAVVIYPEGTRFSERKRQAAIERDRSKRRKLARQLRHTLPPLRRGPLQLLADNPGADLLFLGHSGLETATDLRGLLSGDLVDQEIKVRFTYVPFDDCPRTKDGQKRLLVDAWRRLDDWIDQEQAKRTLIKHLRHERVERTWPSGRIALRLVRAMHQQARALLSSRRDLFSPRSTSFSISPPRRPKGSRPGR